MMCCRSVYTLDTQIDTSMSDMTLLPCPFCGSQAKLYHDTRSDSEQLHYWIVQCTNVFDCLTKGIATSTAENAAQHWNRRYDYDSERADAVVDFVKRVCIMAERKIEMTHKLEGAHYASMMELVKEYES